ncbi:MAG: macro domain-containing protein [Pyrodictiaceae archaeon]
MLQTQHVLTCGAARVEVAQGDITKVECDAIVNAANSLMIMGGGVAGAIRRAAGDEVEEEARRHAPVPVGKAIITSSGRLAPRIKAIIHAPTMERPAMRTTVEKVKKAAKAALEVAEKNNLACIAFPALGAGVGGLHTTEAVKAILEAIEEQEPSKVNRIILVAYTSTDYNQFLKAIREFLRGARKCKAVESPEV